MPELLQADIRDEWELQALPLCPLGQRGESH